jgi:hypothetical protein
MCVAIAATRTSSRRPRCPRSCSTQTARGLREATDPAVTVAMLRAVGEQW